MSLKFMVPDGYTEKEVVSIIQTITNMLAPRFTFGYYDVDDIKQFGFLEACKALPKYEPTLDSGGVPTRPLEKFLYRHIYRRYINLLRDKYRRADPPCSLCHEGRSSEHDDQRMCRLYSVWRSRNNQKSNLVNSDKSIENYDCFPAKLYSVDTPEQNLILKETLEQIDLKLPAELRSSYLKMRDGVYVAKAKRLKVENAVREIIKCQ